MANLEMVIKGLEALDAAIRDHDWLRVRAASASMRAVLVESVPEKTDVSTGKGKKAP